MNSKTVVTSKEKKIVCIGFVAFFFFLPCHPAARYFFSSLENRFPLHVLQIRLDILLQLPVHVLESRKHLLQMLLSCVRGRALLAQPDLGLLDLLHQRLKRLVQERVRQPARVRVLGD